MLLLEDKQLDGRGFQDLLLVFRKIWNRSGTFFSSEEGFSLQLDWISPLERDINSTSPPPHPPLRVIIAKKKLDAEEMIASIFPHFYGGVVHNAAAGLTANTCHPDLS